MVNFREVKLGDTLDIRTYECDGKCTERGIVTEICDDHAIVTDIHDTKFHGVLRNAKYWLDDDTAIIFYKSEKEAD